MRLFDPITVGGVEIPNRIVKSAMAEGRCDAAGMPRPSLARLYERWSAGGVGLAITGMAHVRRGYGFTGHEIGLYDDAVIPALREVTRAVHRHPGKIFAQLCWAPPQLPPTAARRLGNASMSAGFNRVNLRWQRALRDEELRAIAADFGAAARRARLAGFDGIQLHGAHGYLISRSLSPRHNRRRAPYGGGAAARLTLLHEIYTQVRAAVGTDFPVTIKLNAHDGQRGGLDRNGALAVARQLQRWGMAAIEVSAGVGDVGLGFYPNRGGLPIQSSKRWLGQTFPFLRPVLPALGPVLWAVGRSVALREEAYFAADAKALAAALDIPVICVGGIRSRDVAEALLRDSPVAMVSLARPLVREPELPARWQRSSGEADCTSCNECFVHIGLGEVLTCHSRNVT